MQSNYGRGKKKKMSRKQLAIASKTEPKGKITGSDFKAMKRKKA
tara:strand:+ start:1133 stop:1264 length:132 start_codon:yes stop_codon:yes gene_type:complete